MPPRQRAQRPAHCERAAKSPHCTGNAISEPAIGMVVPGTANGVFVTGRALVAVAQPATAPVVMAAAACSALRRVIVRATCRMIDFIVVSLVAPALFCSALAI